MKRYSILLILLLTTVVGVAKVKPELHTVRQVDLGRYEGLWYEFARYPNFFEKVTYSNIIARYRSLGDGNIEVTNRAMRQDGSIDSVVGVARIVAKDGSNSKLKVRFAPKWLSFIPLVWGDYWIIELDSVYRYAVIGEPSRKYLWILSRSPKLEESLYNDICGRLPDYGYDPKQLLKPRHDQH